MFRFWRRRKTEGRRSNKEITKNLDNNEAKLRERCSFGELRGIDGGEKKKKKKIFLLFDLDEKTEEETPYALWQVSFLSVCSYSIRVSISNQSRVRLCPHISLLLVYFLIYFYSYSLLFLKVVRWFPKSTQIYSEWYLSCIFPFLAAAWMCWCVRFVAFEFNEEKKEKKRRKNIKILEDWTFKPHCNAI